MYFLKILTTYSEDCDSEGIFCQMAISVAVFVFCIVCKLETSNLAVLSDIFICIHPTIKNIVIPWRTPLRLIMLHCTGMGTPLSFDYIVSSFLGMFIISWFILCLSNFRMWYQNQSGKLCRNFEIAKVLVKLGPVTHFRVIQTRADSTNGIPAKFSYCVKSSFPLGFFLANVKYRKSGV